MRLPRWLVILMLTSSVLAVLTAAGWWWVTWPERKVEVYNALIDHGEFTEAQSMVLFGPNWRFIPFPDEPFDDQRNDQLRSIATLLQVRQDRTLVDMVLGRQRFTGERDKSVRYFGGARIVPMAPPTLRVERGRITCVSNWVMSDP